MKQIRVAVAGRRGGTGRTTIALVLGSLLAHRGHKTLVVDCDPQGNVAHYLGLDPNRPGTADLLLGNPIEPTATAQPHLFVLPGNLHLLDPQIGQLGDTALARAIDQFDAFDIIFIDCPPANAIIESLAMRAASKALLVDATGYFAISGIPQTMADLAAARQHGARTPSSIAIVSNETTRFRTSQVGHAPYPADLAGLPRFSVQHNLPMAMSIANYRQPIMILPEAQRHAVAADFEPIADWCLAHTATVD